MLPWIADIASTFVEIYGIPAIFIIFLIEGLLVGKLIPTRTIFIGALVLIGPEIEIVLGFFIASVLGSTIGQSILFVAIRRKGPSLIHQIPFGSFSRRQLTIGRHWFDRWGLQAVVISNMLPIIRGYLTIPVALSNVPTHHFPGYSMVGSMFYVTILIGIALGVDVIIGWY